jgi:hypothetical protein
MCALCKAAMRKTFTPNRLAPRSQAKPASNWLLDFPRRDLWQQNATTKSALIAPIDVRVTKFGDGDNGTVEGIEQDIEVLSNMTRLSKTLPTFAPEART